MPRKPVQYTWEFPSHIVTRSNNRDWFNVPIERCWEIYTEKLDHISDVYEYSVHAFTLMDNHSHLIGTPSQNYDQGIVMRWLQTSVARAINRESGQTNHVFGDRYKPSLITTPFYYSHAVRYIYQNPLRARICTTIQEYSFSTAGRELEMPSAKGPRIIPPTNGIDHLLTEMSDAEKAIWYNELLQKNDSDSIKRALGRRNFKIAKPRGSPKPHWMSNSLKKN